MNTNWLMVYALSVSNSLGIALCFIGSLFTLISLIALVISFVVREDDKEISDLIQKWVKITIPAFLVVWVISLLIPKTDDLIKAYMLVEGSELVTAENAEEAAKAVGKRIDKLIDSIGK